MYVNYTHEFSNYPSQVIELSNYKDVDDSVANLINNINSLRQEGKYGEASILITQYADIIKPYCINADTINKIVEEIRNTQIKATSALQSVFYAEDVPEDVNDGDVWIGGGTT